MKYYMVTIDCLVMPGVVAWLDKANSEEEAWSNAYKYAMRQNTLDCGSVEVVEVPNGTQLYKTIIHDSDIVDIVSLDVIKHRYFMDLETYDGFEDYVANGFVNRFGEVEYEEYRED